MTGQVAAGYYAINGATSRTPLGRFDGCVEQSDGCGTICAGYYSDVVGAKTCQGAGTIESGYYVTCGATMPGPSAGECVGQADDGTPCQCGLVDDGYFSTGGGTTATPVSNGNGCVGANNTCGACESGSVSNNAHDACVVDTQGGA